MRAIQRVNSTTTVGSGPRPSTSIPHLLDDEDEHLITVCLHLDPDEEPFCSTVDVSAGRSLIDALTPFLTQNGVAPAHVEIFLENSKTPIPPISEARFLVGQRLNVRLKPMRIQKSESRASDSAIEESDLRQFDDEIRLLGSNRTNSSRNLLGPSAFYEGPNNFTVPRRKGSLNVDGTAPIGIDDRFYGTSVDAASSYANSQMSGSLNGTRRLRAPSSTRRMTIFGKVEKFTAILDRVFKQLEESSILTNAPYFEIEEHFSRIVDSRYIVDHQTGKHQSAIWEIVTTEHRYIKFLHNMCNLHKTLLEVKHQGFLKEVEPSFVFLNFAELFQSAINFWHRGILPMLNRSRQTGECLNAVLLREVFEDICIWSECYIAFNVNFKNSRSYMEKQMKDETFAEFVKWIEAKPFMHRQRLIDILASPVQHLTRYPLMLRSVFHTAPHSADKLQIQAMFEKADEANVTLNFHMSNNDLLIQLTEIMKTIESFDVVDSDEYSKIFQHACPTLLNLASPMPMVTTPVPSFRRTFCRGDLKLKEGRATPKTEVYCFVFTDMFLICKATSRRADRLRVYKSPLHIGRLQCIPFIDGNGFYLVSHDMFGAPNAFYMFYATNIEDAKRWRDAIQMATAEFHRISCDDSAYAKPFLFREQDLLPLAAEPMGFYHRKSHSMDSQAIAHHHATAQGLRRDNGETASAEQLDRRGREPETQNGLNRPQKILVDDEAPRLRPTEESRPSEEAESTDSSRPGDETPSTPSAESPSGRQSAGRRFEKRYHTVGEVEATKTTPLNPITSQSTILKRFSWNVGSQKKISRLSDKLQTTKPNLSNSRRFSQSTTESNDSFGSSTSGISTSSSHDTNTPSGSGVDEFHSCHISRVRIDEHSEAPTPSAQSTETPIDDGQDKLNIELGYPPPSQSSVENPPPVPHVPPPDTDPSSGDDDPDIPILLEQQPDLLKLILNDELDTSIV